VIAVTTPTTPNSTPMSQWTPGEWIDEAIEQYAAVRTHLANWHAEGRSLDYQEAANATQRSIAAAAIASAKMHWDMTDS
jgi:hypothetical protein